jgi:hypothetical protein
VGFGIVGAVRQRWIALALGAVVIGSGCGTTTSDQPTQPASWAELRQQFHCDDLVKPSVGPQINPIRGSAATRGMRCTAYGATVHIFERAPVGSDPHSPNHGGTIENVERVVDAGMTAPGCDVKLLITDRYFALANNRDTLDSLTAQLGRSVQPVEPARPTDSYLPPNCDLLHD